MLDRLLNSKPLKRTLAGILLISFLILSLSLLYPATRRAERIAQVGSGGSASVSSLSTAMTYFAGDALAELRQQPQENDLYRHLCGLLTRVKNQGGFDRTYLVHREGSGKYFYLLDGGYRDNATPGVDYQIPGAEYTGPVQQAVRKIDEGGGYSKDIVTTADHRRVVVSTAPVHDPQGAVIGILVTEAAIGDVGFSQLGPVDLVLVAMVSGGVFLVALLLILSLRRLRKSREEKRRRAEAEVASQAEAASQAEEARRLAEAAEAAAQAEAAPRLPASGGAGDQSAEITLELPGDGADGQA